MHLWRAAILAGAGALAFGPASAQVDPLAPLPQQRAPVAQPAQLPPAPVYRPLQPAPSQATSSFERYKSYLTGRARSAGVRESTIQAVIPQLRLNSRVIELDRAQRPTSTGSSGPPSYGSYLNRHITSSLINLC